MRPAALEHYFESLDRLANLEFKARPGALGGTDLRYRAARQAQGHTALTGQVARALLARLPGSTVVLVTGTGNPVWLPRGETDGPSGVAVLARALAAMGVRTCVLSEARFLPGIVASVRAAGVPLLEETGWRQRGNAALALEFPTGADEGRAFANALLPRLPDVSAIVFIEKPGPNAAGVFHNSSGKPKAGDWVAHAHLLAPLARDRGLVTVGVGDGGNEIGFGRVREALADVHPWGRDCGCPCHGGLLDATEVAYLLPASVSNWGGYAIATGLVLASGCYGILPPWADVERSIAAPLEAGAVDGYSGLAVPTVDGTSPSASHAIYSLMLETVRMAGEAAAAS